MDKNSADGRAVEVTEAGPAHASMIQNLMQLYTHDFSEFWAGTSRGDLNSEGLFPAYPLEDYWSRTNWSAGLIWCESKLAGFTLVNDVSHSGLAAARNMGEFFVVRKYRGSGIGRIAAELLFSRQPGSWELAVARRNTRALQFWRKVVRSSAQASDIEEMDVQSAHWNGPILRFVWGTM
jgi:predicted acetyltransferase